MDAARMELEEREKVREELQGVRVWLEAADGLLSEMEQNNSTEELQVGHSSALTSVYQGYTTPTVSNCSFQGETCSTVSFL